MTITIPTIHLNGDSRAELVRQNRLVYDRANALLDALTEAGPNGRNFYVQGDDAIKHAQVQHRQRVSAVVSVRTDAEMILHAIMED